MSTKAKDASATTQQPGPAPSVADANENGLAVETEEAEIATLVPDTGETSEGGKLKMIVQLLKRCLGVKDLAAMYVSLLYGLAAALELMFGLLFCFGCIW